MPLMVLGMILLTASLLLQAASLLTSLPTWPWTYPSHQLWQSILPAGIIMLCLLHALGLLSTSFILGEGQMACFLVATMALLLLHCAVGASMHPAASEVYIHAKTQHTAATVTGNQRDLTHTVGLIDKNANRCSFEQMFQCTSDKRQHYRGCNEAVMWGLGIMMCNAVLGCTGLVTRTGHDAMHKAAAGKAFLSPDVHTSISQHNAAVPVFLGVDAFCASLHWLSDGLQQTQALIVPALCVLSFPLVLLGGVCTSERTQHNTSRMTLLEVDSVEYFVWLAYGAIATLWVVQGQSLGHLPLLACVPASLQRQQSSILRLLHVLCQQPVVSTLMTRPLNVLLPELVFGLVLSSLALNGLCSISAYVNKRNTHQPNSYVWTAILIAPVLLVLGSSFALISILALAQCICIKQLFCSLYTASSLATGQDIARPSKGMTAPSGWVNVAEGGAWTLISTQLFFCTGHFCEFAGLQYSAGEQCVSLLTEYVSIYSPAAHSMCHPC